MPGATLVSARPFYHILLKMSIGKMHKKNPRVALPGVPLCRGVALYFSRTPSIQDGTGLWDRVDWLNPSKAFRNEGRQG